MSESQKVLRKLKQVTLICTLFIALEVLGGVLANSIAIISDALHLLSDAIAFALSAFVVWLSTQKSPTWLPFGYHKAQPLGALLNILMIYFVTAYLFIEATERILNKEVVEKPSYMLITSIFGLGCNLIMMKILHSVDTPHHEGCSHHHISKHKSTGTAGNCNTVSICHDHHDHSSHVCNESSLMIPNIPSPKASEQVECCGTYHNEGHHPHSHEIPNLHQIPNP